jgi:hypothetical protein
MTISLKRINFRASVRSKPVRENFTDLENTVNNLQAQINALATPPTGTEVTNARDYQALLRDRLRSASKLQGNAVVTGGIVSQQTVANMTVKISAGEAIVNGISCSWAAQNSGTITAPSIKRFDAVVVNSDNSISIVAGNDSADAVLPNVANSQKVVAIISLLSSTTSITTALIRNCNAQGAWVDGFYFWKIMDAVSYISGLGTKEGQVYVCKGIYYEEIILTGLSNIGIFFENGSSVYRPSATEGCVKCVNTLGNESSFITIWGGRFYGNSKSGAIALMTFTYVNDFYFQNCYLDNNTSSTATNKRYFFTNCFRDSVSPDYANDNVKRFNLRGY